jgi:hypothetical protein
MVKKRADMSMNTRIFLILGIIMAAIFLPTSTLLAIGMMPTFVAFIVDRSRTKTKAITVGAMNLAGCMPFLIELWTGSNSVDTAIDIILDPVAVIVMYSAAGVGYLIDWMVSGLVASMMYQKGLMRKNAIKERQEALITRWGPEVTGEIPLDESGFPIETKVK